MIERPAWRVKPAHAHADSDLTGPYAAAVQLLAGAAKTVRQPGRKV